MSTDRIMAAALQLGVPVRNVSPAPNERDRAGPTGEVSVSAEGKYLRASPAVIPSD